MSDYVSLLFDFCSDALCDFAHCGYCPGSSTRTCGQEQTLWVAAVSGQRQEQEGSQRPSARTSNIFILLLSNLCSSFEGVPKKNLNPKKIRTESTLAKSKVVLI